MRLLYTAGRCRSSRMHRPWRERSVLRRPALVARLTPMAVRAEVAKRARPVAVPLRPLPRAGVAGCGVAAFVAVSAGLFELGLQAMILAARLAELS